MATAYVLGATGHAGSYMVPVLCDAGYEVTAVSRGNREPYTKDMPQWKNVKRISASRDEAIPMIAKAHPDVIVDLIAYTVDDMKKLCEALYAEGGYENTRLIFTGSVWIFDKKFYAPCDEEHPRTAEDAYGRGKAEIAAYLHEQYREKGLKATTLHPGHICGKGWIPVGPTGNRDPGVLKDIMAGRQVVLPGHGNATLAHVHSEDIARLAAACLQNDVSIDQEFISACADAITLYGFAAKLYKYYGHEPNIAYASYEDFMAALSEEDRRASMEHIDRCPLVTMAKAEKLLGFKPKYSDWETVIESIESIKDTL